MMRLRLAGVAFMYSPSLFKLIFGADRPIIKKPAVRKSLCLALILGSLSFLLIEAFLILNSFSNEEAEADYLIILGAGVKGETVTPTLEERLIKGLEYLRTYPDAEAVVSGGKGPGEDITEALAMERYLVSHGIAQARIIKEENSTSTMENFRFSKDIISKREEKRSGKLKQGSETGDRLRVIVITNDFHMLRAKMLAKRVGFEPYGISCPTPRSVIVNSFAREYFALIKSFLLDKA